MAKEKKEKEEKKVTKKKVDKMKIATKIIAGFMVFVMVAAFAGTLMFYVFR